MHDPKGTANGLRDRELAVARETGMTVIEVSPLLAAAPDREQFLCLDGIHMTEPYHRLMAKQWLGVPGRSAWGGPRRRGAEGRDREVSVEIRVFDTKPELGGRRRSGPRRPSARPSPAPERRA